MLTVIVPTRGRPNRALQLLNTIVDTRQIHDTNVVFSVDSDDPELDLYHAVAEMRPDMARVDVVKGGWMVAALNETAARVVLDPEVSAVGFLGDDHRPRTNGWDASYLSALRVLGAGIVFGNDLLQFDFVPTQCAMSADIVRRLGWMCHPSLKHMYVDTLWRDMAKPVGKLVYLPDVIVEHLHYINNKSTMDEGYERVNHPDVYRDDEQAFQNLHATGVVRSASEVIRQLAAVTTR